MKRTEYKRHVGHNPKFNYVCNRNPTREERENDKEEELEERMTKNFPKIMKGIHIQI